MKSLHIIMKESKWINISYIARAETDSMPILPIYKYQYIYSDE